MAKGRRASAEVTEATRPALAPEYFCRACGFGDAPSAWFQCPNCGEYGTAVSDLPPDSLAVLSPERALASVLLDYDGETSVIHRHPTGYALVDAELGGGLAYGHRIYLAGGPGPAKTPLRLAHGRTIYLAGAPGSGKTTLALRTCETVRGVPLFVSGEESEDQTKQTIVRAGLARPIGFLYEDHLPVIFDEAARVDPTLLVINSLDKMLDPARRGAPGSSTQIKHCMRQLVAWTSARDLCTLVIGQLTWDNHSAGPRAVEHDASCVLYLRVDAATGARTLVVRKSRISLSPAWFQVPHQPS